MNRGSENAEMLVPQRRFGRTARQDAWWLPPLIVVLGLSSFVVYATWAAFQGQHYRSGPYLSPFYSPELFHVAALEMHQGELIKSASIIANPLTWSSVQFL